MRLSEAEELFYSLVKDSELGLPHREFRFAPVRRWRFDFAWPDIMLAVEIEGITGGKGGRHQRVRGFLSDAEKYEQAMLLGWTVYRVPGSWVKERPKHLMENLRVMWKRCVMAGGILEQTRRRKEDALRRNPGLTLIR